MAKGACPRVRVRIIHPVTQASTWVYTVIVSHVEKDSLPCLDVWDVSVHDDNSVVQALAGAVMHTVSDHGLMK